MSSFLKTLPTEDIIEQIIEVPKREWIQNVPFEHFFNTFGSDEGFKTIENAFYSKNSLIPTVSYQKKIDLEDSFLYYQIPFKNRSDGVLPNTFVIEYASGDEIIDDGNGNLINIDEEIVGNIFYNSGIVVVKGDGQFENGVLYSQLEDSDSIMYFDKKTFFLKQKFFIKINPSDYNSSSNPSFFGSNVESPLMTRVILTNDQDEVILAGTLNKPIPTDQETLVVIDATIPIY
jgi:hypothetical protein